MGSMNIPLRSLLCLAVMAATAVPAGAAGHGKEPAIVLDETLSVEVKQGRVLLHIKLHNRSAGTIRVAKEIATENELERGLFEVKDSDSGAAIAYTGMMVKRSAPTAQDYVAIKPRGSRSNTIEISKSYEFQPGRRYTLRHVPGYLAVGGNPELPTATSAVTATFER
jgi:hypothetical protein